MIKAPKGTQDLLPNESYKWQYLENKIRKITRLYNIKEIRTPIFESTELFCRGVGDSTDVVNKEMYSFEDKGGRNITLRPEGTAGVARSYIENGLFNEPKPIKAYYMGNMFRYERPQKGRFRQFNQFGIEYFGTKSAIADAEVMCIAVDLFKELGIKNVSINLNSMGNIEDRDNYKLKLKAYFEDKLETLCSDCKTRFIQNPLRLLDCKIDMEKDIVKNAPSILDSLSKESKEHFESVKKMLELKGIKYKINDRIVRGLDYYTNTVFELIADDIEGPSKVIGGGGRYDALVETLGGKPSPAVGFGMGMERVILLLEQFSIKIPKARSVEVYVLKANENIGLKDIEIANSLRENGISAEIDMLGRSFKSQLKYANKLDANYVVFVGDEIEIKDMQSGEQEKITEDKIVNYFSKKEVITNGR